MHKVLLVLLACLHVKDALHVDYVEAHEVASKQNLTVQLDAYESVRRQALDLLERGFHLGGGRQDREALHER